MAACLAANDDALNVGKKDRSEVESSALAKFAKLRDGATAKDGCVAEEVLASQIYAKFARNGVSKAIAAQYLSERLQTQYGNGDLTSEQLRSRLPIYLIQAIEYVTGDSLSDERQPAQEEGSNE